MNNDEDREDASLPIFSPAITRICGNFRIVAKALENGFEMAENTPLSVIFDAIAELSMLGQEILRNPEPRLRPKNNPDVLFQSDIRDPFPYEEDGSRPRRGRNSLPRDSPQWEVSRTGNASVQERSRGNALRYETDALGNPRSLRIPDFDDVLMDIEKASDLLMSFTEAALEARKGHFSDPFVPGTGEPIVHHPKRHTTQAEYFYRKRQRAHRNRNHN